MFPYPNPALNACCAKNFFGNFSFVLNTFSFFRVKPPLICMSTTGTSEVATQGLIRGKQKMTVTFLCSSGGVCKKKEMKLSLYIPRAIERSRASRNHEVWRSCSPSSRDSAKQSLLLTDSHHPPGKAQWCSKQIHKQV